MDEFKHHKSQWMCPHKGGLILGCYLGPRLKELYLPFTQERLEEL
jgi:hypothetical protein